MNEKVQTTRDYLTEFRDAFNAGINNIVKAASIYVEAIDHNPLLADRFVDEFSETVPATAWAGFEAVGRKWMHPRLLMGGGGRYSNKIKRLPYSTQERIFEGGRFDLLTSGGDTLKIDIREATPAQVEQLLDGSHVRTPSEQRAYIESQSMGKDEADPMPYTVSDGRVTFRRGTVLTKNEVRRLLVEM
jgi:hypothetical protein